MAQAKPSAKAEAPAETPPAKHRGKWLLIVTLVLVFCVVIIALLAAAFLLGRKANPPANGHEPVAAAPAPAAPALSAIDLEKPPVFVPLDVFTISLQATNGDHYYLQTTIVLRVPDQKTAEALKGWMPEIQNRIDMLLSSKTVSEVQNREPLQHEILKSLNALFGVPPPPPDAVDVPVQGPIQGVLFKSFIIQAS